MKSEIEKLYGLNGEENKIRKIQGWLILAGLIFAVGLVFLVGLLNRKEELILVTDDNQIEFWVDGSLKDSIDVGDIVDIHMAEDWNYETIDEYEWENITYGTAVTDEQEEVTYYVYQKPSDFIVIETDEKIYVFNYISDTYTAGFYEGLLDIWNK